MEKEDKTKHIVEVVEEDDLLGRRDFLKGLKKWSQIVIGGVVLGGIAPTQTEAGWINRRGGWYGGGGWVNLAVVGSMVVAVAGSTVVVAVAG